MEWSDDAIVLSVRAHGESSAIVDALTHEHGRHAGLVRGGGSRKSKPALQPGNSLHLVWRARLTVHLGNYTAEPARARSGRLMDSRAGLIGLNAFTAVTLAVLPERVSICSPGVPVQRTRPPCDTPSPSNTFDR